MPSNHHALALAEPAVEPRVPEAPPRPHLRPVPPLVSPRRGSDRDDDAALVTADGPSDDHALDPGRPAAKASTTSPFPDDPALLVENLVRCVVEILAGARDLDQVSRWVTEDVYRTLHTRVVLAARARSAHGTRVQRPAFTTGGEGAAVTESRCACSREGEERGGEGRAEPSGSAGGSPRRGT